MTYIPRQLEGKIQQYVSQFPAVILTGARQTGKSTLLKHLFLNKDNWRYITLDQRSVLERIQSDPDLFVKDIDSNIIIDESQKAPNLFHSIKWKIDQGTRHKIILSGSANFHLMRSVTETLAGRAGVLELYPLSLSEKYKKHSCLLEILLAAKNPAQLIESIKEFPFLPESAIVQHALWGGYPKLLEYRNAEAKLNWFENYRTSYIERDLRDLAQVADINDFQRFYQALAFQSGGILNLSSIANDIGISVPTCKKYLDILLLSYQFFALPAYHLNVKKRLIKAPKIYVTDTGLGNYLVENLTIGQKSKASAMFGRILENAFIAEILKHNTIVSPRCNLFFWRTSNGAEVDLMIEHGNDLIPIEIKANVQISNLSIRGLMDFVKLKTPKTVRFGVVIYRGEEAVRLSERIAAIPMKYI